MGVLIDSNLLIAIERSQGAIQTLAERYADVPVYISVISVSELLYGVEQALTPAKRADRASFVEKIIRAIPVLDIQERTARIHAKLDVTLDRQGNRIGADDLWIAAQCIEHGLTLITRNLREFQRVPGLQVTQW